MARLKLMKKGDSIMRFLNHFQKPKKVVAVIMIEPPKFRKLRAL